jgi:NAD(P)H-dependent FMN reductase
MTSAAPRILAFAGSVRKASFNRKVLAIAAEGARAAGAEVTVVDLGDYPMPIYDGDLEAAHGLPANAVRLQDVFLANQGLLIAAPEYNSSITPLLKNTLDWVSRPHGERAQLAAYRGKTAALVAASPGALGGLRGLVHVRQILSNIGVHVIPDQQAVARAGGAFDDGGTLKDEIQAKSVRTVGERLAEVTRRLAE